MTDLNTMMRDQARAGLQTQLDAAVTAGDTEAARKITADMERLAVQTAPKAPPYGDVEIRAQLDKQDWFGVDPKKSARAVELGKSLDPKKFPTAEAFTTALVKAVDDEFKPAAPVSKEDDGGETDEEREAREAEETAATDGKAPKTRKTDGPKDADSAGRPVRRVAGPWTKLADAPKEVQAEIKRAADKFVPANSPKERRESFIAKALESQYAVHQRAAGKK